MWNKSYKSLYNKIQTSEEMDQRILQNLRKELGARRRISQRKLVFRFGAVMMLCFIMVQGKPIYAAVEKAIQHFVNRLEFQNDGSDKVIVEMEGTYLKLNEKAKKEPYKTVVEKIDLKEQRKIIAEALRDIALENLEYCTSYKGDEEKWQIEF